MNFITFPASATNMFPAANSTTGSQLLTEWNLKSRESVGTEPEVTYTIGPSFVHNDDDFEVSIQTDAGGTFVNTYTLSIAPGRGVINGHFVETLVPMTIDLVEANANLYQQARPILKGELAVGLRTFFSTEQTLAGSILTEDENDMFLGIQVVILPEKEMITPADSPYDQSKVTADIKLATFTFINNVISTIRNLSTKLQYIPSKRIANIAGLVDNRYVTKIGLNPKKLYAFAGKSTDPSTGRDTWEDVTDSLMIWDADPQRSLVKPTYKQAEFVTASDQVYLVIPHKQVTGMTNDDGIYEYYDSRIMTLPTASYSTNTPGLVNRGYTQQIKDIALQVSDFRTMLNGKQILFLDTKDEGEELPQINDAWNDGDYILVKNDNSYYGDSSDTSGPPATLYVVLPGQVESLRFIAQVSGNVVTPAGIPDNIEGVQLGSMDWYESAGQDKPDTQHPQYYPVFFDETDTMRGVPYNSSTGKWNDYFKLRYYLEEEDPGGEEPFTPVYPYIDYYYGVYTTGDRTWSDAVMLTGSIPFATEDVIGGFLNADSQDTDAGYVIRDDEGKLKLLDYELLRSGTLAYQIGSDITLPSNSTIDELQSYLDEYVNERVAFPSVANVSITPSILHIYLNLSASDEEEVLNIHGIDSRFNTAVCLHIEGSATSTTTINIYDCQKFKIDSSIEGTPVINVYRTNLYYDPIVFQYIKTCTRDSDIYGTFTGFQDLGIWYEQIDSDDPALVANGMTISELDTQVISTEIDYWKELGTAINDNNYLVALKSITFSTTGDIVGCEILAANNSTDNIEPGDKIIVGEIVLPQGVTLIYPTACLTRVLKVTGEFTSAYYSDGNWYVTDTSFSLGTGTYNAADPVTSMTGTVAFHSITSLVPSTISQTSIDVWESDAYHLFRGGAIS